MKKNTNIYHNTANFSVLSISYEKADAETRGKFAFFDENIKEFVRRISEKQLGDAFVVSTCNRTEIYTTTPNYIFIVDEYCKLIGVHLLDFMRFANILNREDALNHLFRVAGGLESQIIGDFEIIGQIKKAYNRFKKEKKNSNPYLERAINSAIQISKKIKNETGISNGAASVSYAAVYYILNHQKNISDKNILLLGVGEIGQNTVENLMKHIYQPNIKIANRSSEKAEKIAEKYNWHPHSIAPFYTNNRIYLSKKCGTFHYDDSLVLTQKDQPRRSMWQLPSFFAEKGIAISWQGHTHPVIKGDSSILKTASRGQEFVITTDTKEQEENLSDWVKEITSHK